MQAAGQTRAAAYNALDLDLTTHVSRSRLSTRPLRRDRPHRRGWDGPSLSGHECGKETMRHRIPVGAVLMTSVVLAGLGCQQSSETEVTDQTAEALVAGVPTFRVDPDWPAVPAQWKLGDVSSVAIDAQDNVWMLHRPRTLSGDEAEMAAPAVIGFDSEGNFIRAWGGAGDGYEWPQREHGLHIDHRGVCLAWREQLS